MNLDKFDMNHHRRAIKICTEMQRLIQCNRVNDADHLLEMELRKTFQAGRFVKEQSSKVGDTLSLNGFTLARPSTCTYDGKPINITPKVFEMAWLFFKQTNQIIPRDVIREMLCLDDSYSTPSVRSIEQHIYMLRHGLKLDGTRGLLLRVVYKKGYILRVIA